MLTVVLALGSSACYGVSNFLGPQLAVRDSIVYVLVVSQLAALGGCVAFLAVQGGPALGMEATGYATLAGLGNAFGLIGFYKAAELGPLSIVAPIGAMGATVPVVWGLLHGDQLGPLQVPGLVLALAGSALAARQTAQAAASYRDPRASVLWAMASAVAFGIFLTAIPSAAEDGQAWALLDARVVLIAVMAVWAGRQLRTLRIDRRTPLLAIPGLLLVMGTLFYVAAADRGQLSLVSVLGSLFPVVTVGLGVAVLGERPSRTQAAGVAAALAGVVLIAA